MFTATTLAAITYARKSWAPYILAKTRKATTMQSAFDVPALRPMQRRTSLVALDLYEYEEQRAEFARWHHTRDCSCDMCVEERMMRADAYELEYEVGMAAHYEAMEEHEEVTEDDEFAISDEDWAEVRARNEERGTAFGWWY